MEFEKTTAREFLAEKRKMVGYLPEDADTSVVSLNYHLVELLLEEFAQLRQSEYAKMLIAERTFNGYKRYLKHKYGEDYKLLEDMGFKCSMCDDRATIVHPMGGAKLVVCNSHWKQLKAWNEQQIHEYINRLTGNSEPASPD